MNPSDPVQVLRQLGRWKYDRYAPYGPGARFTDRLAPWLDQFAEEDRMEVARHLAEELVFVSDVELANCIELAWSDHVRPWLMRVVAPELGLDWWQVARAGSHPNLPRLVRRTLVVGLADGARLDQLRRASPPLSTYQFLPSWHLDGPLEPLQRQLRRALDASPGSGPADDDTFRHLVLVDDFSGTGGTLLHVDADGSVTGRLHQASLEIDGARRRGEIADDAHVLVMLYVASARAITNIQRGLVAAGLDWSVRVVQPLPASMDLERDEPELDEIIVRTFGRAADVDGKGTRNLGYFGGTLPFVLQHNVPNDASPLLWQSPSTSGGEPGWPLFPRHDRLEASRL